MIIVHWLTLLFAGSSEHQGHGAIPAVQDCQLPETVAGSLQPRGAE